ncbi:ribosome biogenesis GTPase Der [bacterium]|nr:ribosome biogenesis GTPase Der [bacterium]
MAKVALLGRPNVGKSTLFNRLLSGKRAFVDKEAGTTRDRNYAQAEWDGKAFTLIDTGGIRIKEAGLAERIRIQAEIALMEADFIILLLDGKNGLMPEDLEVLRLIRKKNKPFCITVNKKDNLPYKIEELSDFSKLGCDFIPISAMAGINIDTLLDEVIKNLPQIESEEEEELTKIAIIGRPNVGKSSILNRILGKERSLVDEVAGTTRDTVSEKFAYHDKTFLFLDTAGIRKKVSSTLEFACIVGAERSISESNICWLLIDAQEGIGMVDKRLVNSVADKGSALILVVNKWDLAQDPKANYQKWVESNLPFVSHLPIVFTSSITGEGIQSLLKDTLKLSGLYSMNVKTALLNKLLAGIIDRGPASTLRGRSLKLYYATQTGFSPPAFTLWVNNPSLATSNWLKYIKKALIAKLNLLSVPIRLYLKEA